MTARAANAAEEVTTPPGSSPADASAPAPAPARAGAGAAPAAKAAPGPAIVPTPVASPVTAPSAAPAVVPAAPTPTAPALRFYGLIKPTLIFSGSGVESFGQPNASAITSAGNPVLALLPDEARATLQIAQSRLGFWAGEQGPLRAQIELDFIDFGKASPTVAALPRLRIAKLEWAPTATFTLIAGQDWDLHAPVNPHGANLVGGLFWAGNTAFMRQQVKLIRRGARSEVAVALGMPGVNAAPRDGAFELAHTPAIAARAALLPSTGGQLGVSAIGTRLRFTPGGATERWALAGAVALFGDLTAHPSVNVRFEGYVGRNVANLGLLGLGMGNAARDVNEAGGFASIRWAAMGPRHFIYALGGLAAVFDPSRVEPSYSYPATQPGGDPPAPSTAVLAGTGPGVRRNIAARLGYELRVHKQLAFLIEAFHYRTTHTLQAIDQARFDSVATAFGAEAAALLTF